VGLAALCGGGLDYHPVQTDHRPLGFLVNQGQGVFALDVRLAVGTDPWIPPLHRLEVDAGVGKRLAVQSDLARDSAEPAAIPTPQGQEERAQKQKEITHESVPRLRDMPRIVARLNSPGSPRRHQSWPGPRTPAC